MLLFNKVSDNQITFQALDNRMVHFVNNVIAIFALVIQAYVFSWQISLAGTALLVVLTLVIYYFGHLAQIRHARTSGFHETANVSPPFRDISQSISLDICRNYRKHQNYSTTHSRGLFHRKIHQIH